MKIEKYNILTKQQKEEINALEYKAFAADGLQNHAFLSNELNFDRELPCFYLSYEDRELTGFLSVFMPEEYEAEIMAAVHPDYQKKGIFKALLQAAKEVICKTSVEQILYCVEPESRQAGSVLKSLNIADILRSEYRMEATRKTTEILTRLPIWENLRLEKACMDNQEDFARISMEGFEQEERDAAIDKALTSDERRGYILYENNKPVGVFVLGLEDETFIYGVATDQKFKGKGYGRYLMQKALELGFANDDTVVLDVDSENPTALHLYKQCGFEVTFQVDYYYEKV